MLNLDELGYTPSSIDPDAPAAPQKLLYRAKSICSKNKSTHLMQTSIFRSLD